jgi:FKBP-type peptidyl-prolyl cis-trans isomerase
MKKVLLFIASFIVINVANTQNNPKAKPVAIKPLCKTLNDSVSYVIGVSFTNFYKDQGLTVPNLNVAIVSKAITDVLAGKPSLIDNTTANVVMNKYLNKIEEEKAKGNIIAGQQFLAKNKLRPGVKTTTSGLQYEVITQGMGAKPKATDSVTCNYKGTYIDGTEFDNSYKHGGAVTFALNHVISAWTEGLQLMNVGSKFKFYVPYTLGYGVFDYNGIPGGSMLIFEVELIAIKNSQ